MKLEKAVLTMKDGQVITHDIVIESEKYRDVLTFLVSEDNRTCLYIYDIFDLNNYHIQELTDPVSVGHNIQKDIKLFSTLSQMFENSRRNKKKEV